MSRRSSLSSPTTHGVVESLEQENHWLSRKLKSYEEQLREGEEANTNLYTENQQLKEVKKIMDNQLGDMKQELDHLKSSMSGRKQEKEALEDRYEDLEQLVQKYKAEQEQACCTAEEAKAELEAAQEAITRHCDELEDKQGRINQFKHQCSVLEEKSVSHHNDYIQMLMEKEAEISELQNRIVDLESVNSDLQQLTQQGENLNLMAELSSLTTLEHSSPVSDAQSSDCSKLLEKTQELQEMELRLESITVEREISVGRQQDKIDDLEKQLELAHASLSLVEMRDISTSIDDHSDQYYATCTQTEPQNYQHISCQIDIPLIQSQATVATETDSPLNYISQSDIETQMAILVQHEQACQVDSYMSQPEFTSAECQTDLTGRTCHTTLDNMTQYAQTDVWINNNISNYNGGIETTHISTDESVIGGVEYSTERGAGDTGHSLEMKATSEDTGVQCTEDMSDLRVCELCQSLLADCEVNISASPVKLYDTQNVTTQTEGEYLRITDNVSYKEVSHQLAYINRSVSRWPAKQTPIVSASKGLETLDSVLTSGVYSHVEPHLMSKETTPVTTHSESTSVSHMFSWETDNSVCGSLEHDLLQTQKLHPVTESSHECIEQTNLPSVIPSTVVLPKLEPYPKNSSTFSTYMHKVWVVFTFLSFLVLLKAVWSNTSLRKILVRKAPHIPPH